MGIGIIKVDKITKAVIPAAGLGTRFLPATKACPKEMLPIVDKPTIQYIIEEALASGITDILIISGRTKRAIEDHFDRAPELEENLAEHGKEELLRMVKEIGNINIHFVRQKEPLGLGHAILCAKRFVGYEPFAVLLGDDVVYNDEYPCLKQLIDVYNKTGGSVLGCQTVPQEKVSAYGIVQSEPTDNERIFKVNDMVEKPAVEDAPSRLAVLGRYVITPEIFRILDYTAPGKGGEIQLTDALKVLARQQNMYAYDFIGRRYDVGDKQGYLEAQVEFALRREDLRDKFKVYLRRLVIMNKDKAVIVSEIKNIIINLLSNDNKEKFQLIENVDRDRIRKVPNYGDKRQESTLKDNLWIILNKFQKKDFQEVDKTVLADISVELEEIDKMVRGINITNSDKQGIMRIADILHELCTRCYDVLDTK